MSSVNWRKRSTVDAILEMRGNLTHEINTGQVKMRLSNFQEEKFLYYFNFYDQGKDNLLDEEDFKALQKRILEYTQWPERSTLANWSREVHATFFKTLVEKKYMMKGEESKEGAARVVDPDEWIAMWERYIQNAKGISDLPVWLQVLPKLFFEIIDFKSDGRIDKEELAEFYSGFVGIQDCDVEKLADEAFNQMTDSGRYDLDIQTYEQVYSNFLLGRTSNYGPGRYIFGVFDVVDEPLKLIMPADDPPKVSRVKQPRKSVIGPAKRYWRNA